MGGQGATGLNQEGLSKAAGLINYELNMFILTGQMIQLLGSEASLHKNIFLESFVLHCRNSIDFFYPPRSIKADDIIADLYISDVQNWHKIRGDKSRLLDAVGEKVNKQAAHLTFTRLSIEKGWRVADILREISDLWTKFLSTLSEDKRQWFDNN